MADTNGDGVLFDKEPKIPPSVRRKVNTYRDKMVEMGRARTAMNTAKDKALEAMEENDIARVKVNIDGVEKWLVRESKENLVTRAIEKEQPIEAQSPEE